MIVAALGAVVIGVGLRHGAPPWWPSLFVASATAATAVTQGSWFVPVLVVFFVLAGGLGVSAGILSRSDAWIIAWVVAAAGIRGPGLLLWTLVGVMVYAAVRVGKGFPAMVRKRFTEAAYAGASMTMRAPVVIAPAEHTLRVAVWPAVPVAAVAAWSIGVVTLGEAWWTQLPLVF